ncbi:unnamed protein product [Nesidiocoris tenuis]|uniref:G-patch domain-containing protein n=1 Tax=Nesidiocoris tenuis TaxID=355587 RepID=A0A6H5H583_9HEMI|nr:unnamed protein product [Nesidiocoris tenuis]
MSDDEPDYMSDAFLTEAVTQDVRPGLLHSHKQKREHELWKKKEIIEERKIAKPSGQLEAEVREDGLQKPIPQDNKGFAMLAKMGFNPAKGLGKHGQGRMDPIGIDLKTDKQGLGRKAAVKEILEMKRKMLEEHKKKALSVTDFRASLSEKVQERQVLNFELFEPRADV